LAESCSDAQRHGQIKKFSYITSFRFIVFGLKFIFFGLSIDIPAVTVTTLAWEFDAFLQKLVIIVLAFIIKYTAALHIAAVVAAAPESVKLFAALVAFDFDASMKVKLGCHVKAAAAHYWWCKFKVHTHHV
jgi:hypothetical protein